MTAASAAREGGSATVWVLGCCLLLGAGGAAASVRAEAVLARHRAAAAADLAALAAAGRIGVSGGPAQICTTARRIAEANGVRLSRCDPVLAADARSGSVTVIVRYEVRLPLVGVREVQASARAGRLPGAGGPS